MKQVEFRGDSLSKLSFGTVQLGLEYGISNKQGKPTQQTADDIIKYLRSSGINCFDTAIAYGNSEEALGKALPLNTDVHLISKVKTQLFLIDLEKAVRSSLDRLNVSRLFALLLHDSELLSEWNIGNTQAVLKLKEESLISYFGVSIYTSEEFDLAIENPEIDVIQIPFNLFDQRAVRGKWFERAENANKLIFVRSIFLQGLFFVNPDELQGALISAASQIRKIDCIKYKLNMNTAEVAMAYVNSIAKNAILLFGCDTLDQAKENVYTFNTVPTFNEELLQNIYKTFSGTPEGVYNPSKWG